MKLRVNEKEVAKKGFFLFAHCAERMFGQTDSCPFWKTSQADLLKENLLFCY